MSSNKNLFKDLESALTQINMVDKTTSISSLPAGKKTSKSENALTRIGIENFLPVPEGPVIQNNPQSKIQKGLMNASSGTNIGQKNVSKSDVSASTGINVGNAGKPSGLKTTTGVNTGRRSLLSILNPDNKSTSQNPSNTDQRRSMGHQTPSTTSSASASYSQSMISSPVTEVATGNVIRHATTVGPGTNSSINIQKKSLLESMKNLLPSFPIFKKNNNPKKILDFDITAFKNINKYIKKDFIYIDITKLLGKTFIDTITDDNCFEKNILLKTIAYSLTSNNERDKPRIIYFLQSLEDSSSFINSFRTKKILYVYNTKEYKSYKKYLPIKV
jgi:hypothetical protein